MIITKTPFRVSFCGGGTDINSYYKTGYGAVVSMAINKYMYVTVHKCFADRLRVSYSDTENVNHAHELRHSIVRECLKMVGIDSGVEITTVGEVPAGTGLGSSSTLTVGLLNALYVYKGMQLSADELMKRACQIEIDILKSPIGKQDQCAAAFGGINYFRFNADETVERELMQVSDSSQKSLESKLMMFYTGGQRSANDILNEQSKKTDKSLETLNFMRDQANEMRSLLLNNKIGKEFGEMLHNGWLKKRSIVGSISNQKIDEAYEKSLKAGAVGGKLLGAGGGGFMLIYADEDRQQAVRDAIQLKQMYFHVSPYGSRVVYAGE